MDDDKQSFDSKYLDQIFSKDLDEKCTLATNNEVYSLVYSIGDIHGDYQAFHTIITRLINSENKPVILYDEHTKKYYWNSEVSNICIIQTGDIIDGVRQKNLSPDYYEKYQNDDLKIIDIMLTLKEEADSKPNNNKVILLYGNHEIENIFNIINIKDLNYNNYLISDKSKLSEIDFCTFDINPEDWKTNKEKPNEVDFKNYQVCKMKIGNFSINFKDVKLYDNSEENINNYIYNKNLITHRFNYIHKLKDRILCNYQTYAIVNGYLFCHSGFISSFVEKLFNIYNRYKVQSKTDPFSILDPKNKEKSKGISSRDLDPKDPNKEKSTKPVFSSSEQTPLNQSNKQLSLEEFINESLENKNQDFINTFNKIFTKIINYLWKIYDDETLKIEPSLKAFIDEYKQNIHNIIWSDNFRDFYLNMGDTNHIDNYKYVNNSINFILHKLHLNGIIMGHIAENNIRKIKVNNNLRDFYIYLTDIAISRAFHPLIDNQYYIYHKFYNILQIDKTSKISYLQVDNEFKDNVKEIETKEIEINYSDIVNNHITNNELFVLIKEFITNNKLISDDIINSFYINHDKLPDLILSYLKNYLHINITEEINNVLLRYLLTLIDEMLMNKLINYIESLIQTKKLNIFDLNWMYYATINKDILDLQLNDEYKNLEVVQNCFQGLLKVYYNCDTINKEILKTYYNKNLDFINYTVKRTLLDNINSIFQSDLKGCILKDYNLLLKVILFQKNIETLRLSKSKDKDLQQEKYDEFVYKEIIKRLYDIKKIDNKYMNYYTNNFNMNLNETDQKIIEERNKYLMNFISLFEKNITIIISKYKITLSIVINKTVKSFIVSCFTKIIEYVKAKQLEKIRIKIDKNFVFSVEGNETLTFNILEYFVSLKIEIGLLKKQLIKTEILKSIEFILSHNYKFIKLLSEDFGKDLIMYGEITF